MAFDLSNYVTVDERISEAKEQYPEGRFQSEIVELPAAFADKYIAVRASFYRTPDDQNPGQGLAWEPVPGKTPYTKESELMNAETSAWGRALVAALVADAKRGIASANEVRNRSYTPGDNNHVDDASTNWNGDGACCALAQKGKHTASCPNREAE